MGLIGLGALGQRPAGTSVTTRRAGAEQADLGGFMSFSPKFLIGKIIPKPVGYYDVNGGNLKGGLGGGEERLQNRGDSEEL